MAPRTQKAAALKVTPLEVLAAIESLYADRVRPQGRILLKRLGERAAVIHAGEAALLGVPGVSVGSEVVPRLDTAHIRKVCERCPRIQVVAEAGTEYSALLAGRASNFVDPCSNEDPFPERLWSEMAAFFGSYQSRGVHLPGGRYACARALAGANLPFLAGRCLGELCHIVQLAVSQRRVLGYLDGHVVPYYQSEAVVKQHSAVLQQPAWSLKKDATPVADLVQARECLREILASSSDDGAVPLPNIKRLFRSRYQLELSETALGHSRISDLLQDVRFQDVCSLQLRGSTYFVLQGQSVTSDAVVSSTSGDEASEQEVACGEAPEEQSSLWQSVVAARTFIHFQPSPVMTPVRRSSSVPRNHGSGKHSADVSPSDSVSTEATEEDLPSPRRLCFCPDEPLGLEEASSVEWGSSMGFPLMTPSPQYEWPRYGVLGSAASGVASLGCRSFQQEEDLSGKVEVEGRAALSNTVAGGDAQPDAPPCRVQFCPGEPLSLEESAPIEAERSFNFAVVTPSPQYQLPRRAWVAEVPRASSGDEKGDAISLFQSLGLCEASGIEAIVEASESDEDSESERTPMCAEPLGLEEDAPVESSAPPGFPIMTPSPAYHVEASRRYASLKRGQQQGGLGGGASFLAGAHFEAFPLAREPLGLSFGRQPQTATVGGA